MESSSENRVRQHTEDLLELHAAAVLTRERVSPHARRAGWQLDARIGPRTAERLARNPRVEPARHRKHPLVSAPARIRDHVALVLAAHSDRNVLTGCK